MTKLVRIPFYQNHKVPVIKETKVHDWINFGDDNKQFDYFIKLYKSSPTHNAIVSSKIKYVFGKGLKPLGDNTLNDAQLVEFIKNANRRETLNDVMHKAIGDYELFNGFALKISVNAATGKIVHIFHQPFETCRINENGQKVYVSWEWTPEQSLYRRYRGINGRPADLETYNEFSCIGEVKNKKPLFYILYYREYQPGIKIYPLPEYMGACATIETEIEINNFDLNNTKTGFAAGTIITLTEGAPTKDEQEGLEKQFKRKTSGTDNAGEIILYFTDNPDKKPDIQRVGADDMADQFEQLLPRVRQGIFTGHSITSPMLFGERQEGQLGGRNELRDAYELFDNNYCQPRRRAVEKVLKKLLEKNGLKGELIFEKEMPVGNTTGEDKSDTLTINEIRVKQGQEPYNDPLADVPIMLLEKTQSQPDKVQFSKQDDSYLRQFDTIGVSADDYEVLAFKSVTHEVEEELDLYEERLCSLNFGRQFFEDDRLYTPSALTDNEKTVLDYLLEKEEHSLDSLLKKTGLDKDKLIEALNDLQKKNIISYSTVERGGNVYIKRGIESGAKEKPVGYEIKTMYRYWGPNDSKNRPFCKAMLQKNRLYTRQELNNIENPDGKSVWRYKGGWYTDPKTSITRDNCRHIWQAVIVRERKK